MSERVYVRERAVGPCSSGHKHLEVISVCQDDKMSEGSPVTVNTIMLLTGSLQKKKKS